MNINHSITPMYFSDAGAFSSSNGSVELRTGSTEIAYTKDTKVSKAAADSLRIIRQTFSPTNLAPLKNGANAGNGSRFGRGTSVLLLVICLVIAGLLGYLFIVIFRIEKKNDMLEERIEKLQSDMNFTNNRSKLCLPCSELSKGPFPEDNPNIGALVQYRVDGILVCCANSTKQTSVLLNLVRI